MTKRENYSKIANLCKELVKTYKKLDEPRPINQDRKKNSKKSLDIAYTMQYIERTKHEIHCLCVECWLALYEEERYGNKIMCTDNFHQQNINFRKPNIL